MSQLLDEVNSFVWQRFRNLCDWWFYYLKRQAHPRQHYPPSEISGALVFVVWGFFHLLNLTLPGLNFCFSEFLM